MGYLTSPVTLPSTVTCQFIWFNKHVKIDNKTICFHNLSNNDLNLSVSVPLLYFTYKNIYLTEIKKENSSIIFFTTVNKNLLYLKIWSPFWPPLSKIMLSLGKCLCLFLKQTSNAMTRIHIILKSEFYLKLILKN